MMLKQFLTTTDVTAFAGKLGVSEGYVRHLVSGFRKPSVKLVKKIERFTDFQVTKSELRPDIYADSHSCE